MKNLVFLFCLLSIGLLSCKKAEIEKSTTTTPPVDNQWVIVDQGIIVDIQGTDTTWTEGFYDGDGYCCNVQTIELTQQTFQIGQIVNIDGHDYYVIDMNETGYGLAGDGEPQIYSYWIAVVIVDKYIGCVNDMVLAKRLP